MLCASDNYSHPTRLRETADAIEAGNDFVYWKRGYFLNLLNGEHCIYDRPNTPVGLFMAYSRRAFDRIRVKAHEPYPKKGVDTWLRSLAGNITTLAIKEIPLGVHTDGYNTISHGRRDLYGVTEHWKRTDTVADAPVGDPYELFPQPIKNKLKNE